MAKVLKTPTDPSLEASDSEPLDSVPKFPTSEQRNSLKPTVASFVLIPSRRTVIALASHGTEHSYLQDPDHRITGPEIPQRFVVVCTV